MSLKMRSIVATIVAGIVLAACDPIDMSALEDVEAAAEAARTAAHDLNTRTAEMQGAMEDPVGALRTAALGATFTKTPTAEVNLFVLTDLQTGCQWLATYGPANEAVSLVPRTEPDWQGTRQRCISIGTAGPVAGEGPQ